MTKFKKVFAKCWRKQFYCCERRKTSQEQEDQLRRKFIESEYNPDIMNDQNQDRKPLPWKSCSSTLTDHYNHQDLCERVMTLTPYDPIDMIWRHSLTEQEIPIYFIWLLDALSLFVFIFLTTPQAYIELLEWTGVMEFISSLGFFTTPIEKITQNGLFTGHQDKWKEYLNFFLMYLAGEMFGWILKRIGQLKKFDSKWERHRFILCNITRYQILNFCIMPAFVSQGINNLWQV